MALQYRHLGLPLIVLLGVLMPDPAPASADRDSILAVYQAGMAALQAGDYPAYYDRMRDVDVLLPFHPAVLRRIAGGAALTGRCASQARKRSTGITSA